MTLTKAIELLLLDLDNPGSVAIEDLNEAQELGIKAMKCVLEIRHHPFPDTVLQLPGETEE